MSQSNADICYSCWPAISVSLVSHAWESRHAWTGLSRVMQWTCLAIKQALFDIHDHTVSQSRICSGHIKQLKQLPNKFATACCSEVEFWYTRLDLNKLWKTNSLMVNWLPNLHWWSGSEENWHLIRLSRTALWDDFNHGPRLCYLHFLKKLSVETF